VGAEVLDSGAPRPDLPPQDVVKDLTHVLLPLEGNRVQTESFNSAVYHFFQPHCSIPFYTSLAFLLTSKSMTCRFSTSAISRPLLYSSWASWATVSVCGSLSLLPYKISFMDTKHFDTSSDAWRTEKKSCNDLRRQVGKWAFRGHKVEVHRVVFMCACV